MNNNVKIAKELVKLAKELVSVERNAWNWKHPFKFDNNDDKKNVKKEKMVTLSESYVDTDLLNKKNVKDLRETATKEWECVENLAWGGGSDSHYSIEVPESKVEEVKKEFEKVGIKLQE